MTQVASLRGKKIAVLVESQYIADEIAMYVQRFAGYGAAVDLMANLYGNPSLELVSEVEEAGKTPQTLRVTIDFRSVRLQDYAAVIQSANYTSVRLRYFPPDEDAGGNPLPVTPDMARYSPAVQFFARAMHDPDIVKGVLCHGLWILTPIPELLAGRRVICHNVLLADVHNAGGLYVDHPSGVVVDRDLVTGRSFREADRFIDRIKDVIIAREYARLAPAGYEPYPAAP